MLLNRGEFPDGWQLKKVMPKDSELRCLFPFLGKEIFPFKVFIRPTDKTKTIRVTLFANNGKCRDLTLDQFQVHPDVKALEALYKKKLQAQQRVKESIKTLTQKATKGGKKR